MARPIPLLVGVAELEPLVRDPHTSSVLGLAERTGASATSPKKRIPLPNSTGASAGVDAPSRSRWFDTGAFRNPPNYTYGNVGRTLPDVRGPGLANLDFALLKNNRIGEKMNLQFRAEAFNLANRTNLGMPNSTFVVSSQ